jgi:hypothetical protein
LLLHGPKHWAVKEEERRRLTQNGNCRNIFHSATTLDGKKKKWQ